MVTGKHLFSEHMHFPNKKKNPLQPETFETHCLIVPKADSRRCGCVGMTVNVMFPCALLFAVRRTAFLTFSGKTEIIFAVMSAVK